MFVFTRRFSNSTQIPLRPRIVVLGTGWGGSRVAKDLNVSQIELTIVSSRNHMIFTPLLPQTCCGTLEFRSICESIFRIQPALTQPNHHFYNGVCYNVDPIKKVLNMITVDPHNAENTHFFNVPYDIAVLAHGAQPLTFNINGVHENTFFLRDIHEAKGIRRRLIKNIALAQTPGISIETKKKLLRVVVVGGGPTGVEFASDFCDFLNSDVKKMGHELRRDIEIILIELGEILSMFEKTLRDYAVANLEKAGVRIIKASVKEISSGKLTLSSGQSIEFGLCVWNTGVGPSELTKKLAVDKTKGNRILVDKFLRVIVNEKPTDGLFAIGDCSGDLPMLAAVAERQGKYLASMLNSFVKNRTFDYENAKPFEYHHPGSMVSVGNKKALIDLPKKYCKLKGSLAWFIWRSAYLSMLLSIRSRMNVAMNWLSTLLFGRDFAYIANVNEVKSIKKMVDNATREKI